MIATSGGTLIHQRVAQARAGQNPKVIGRAASGWFVLGDVQFLRGYSLLLPDPVVFDLNSLDMASRAAYLSDMTALGDALLVVTGADRINYEILGNSEAALHAHVWPRYPDEPPERRRAPAWFYPREARAAVPFDGARDRPLMDEIAAQLRSIGAIIS